MKNQAPKTEQAGNDRRHSVRMPYDTSLTYANQNEAGMGRVRNISFDGLFFETPRTFTVGDQLNIDFHFRRGRMNMAIMGEITRITADGVGIRLLW